MVLKIEFTILRLRKQMVDTNQTEIGSSEVDSVARQEMLIVLGEMTAGMLHGMKNSLNSAMSALQFYEDVLSGSEKSDETDEIISDISLALNQVIAQMKDVVCYGIDREIIGKQGVDVELAVKKAIRILSHRLTNIDLHTDLRSSFIDGFENQIIQVVMNLISVSIESFSLDLDNKTINIRLYEEDSNVVIEIYDSGPGLNARDIDKIFGLHYRSSKNVGELELGLDLSRHIINSHGGKLEFTNTKSDVSLKVSLPKK
jgi:signal transduction histidine kinase